MRPFAPTDQPAPVPPAAQLDETAQLDDLGAVTAGAVGVGRSTPFFFLDEQQRVADPTVDLMSDRIGGVRLQDRTDEAV